MFKQLLHVSALFAAAAFTQSVLTAGPLFYSFTTTFGGSSGTLESFTSATVGSPTVIGSLGVDAAYGGLAYDTANNTMYMVDGLGDDSTTTHSSLYSVNLTTGAATLIGSTGLADVTGLTYDSANNTLYAAQFEDGGPLEILNIATGAATPVGSGMSSDRIDNLAYDSTNGVLYGWVDCLGCAALYSVNTTTGVGTLLNGSGLDSNDSGIVYDPTTNLLWDLDVRGFLTTIDPSTYVQSSTLANSDTETSGLALVLGTTSTVPEPSTIVFIGSGLAVLFARHRRRTR